jgi:beta-lactamase class A
MLEFGNRSRSLRRRRLAETRQAALPRSNAAKPQPPRDARTPAGEPQRRRPPATRSEGPRPLRRVTPPTPPPRIMRSPTSAFTQRLGSMGSGSEPEEPGLRPRREPSAERRSPAPEAARSPTRRRSAAVAGGTAVQRRGSALTAKSRPEVAPKPRSRSGSAFLYAVRLLILVVGVGAIAGTLLSAINPAGQIADASQQIENAAAEETDALTDPVSNSLGFANVMRAYSGRELTRLKQEVLSMGDLYTGLTPGVFMLDLDTGNTLNINGDVSFAAASMIKVPVLVAFFQEVDAGRIRLDEMLTLEEEDVASGSGEMQFHSVGTQYSALETATLMIIISDNSATNILIRRMGGMEVLNQRFRSWGLEKTVLRNLLPDLEGTNTASPKELAGLMTMVSRGELISLRSRDRLLDIMRRTYTDTLIPAGVGDREATIAHKTGDIGELVGDVGLVDMPNGKRYAITTLMKRSFNDDRAQEWIRQINRMVYEELQRNPTAARGEETRPNAEAGAALDTISEPVTPLE